MSSKISTESVFNHHLPVCFIGGPYSQPDPCANVNACARLVNRLWQDGKVFPICPMVESHFQHTMFPRSYTEWTQRTARFIAFADVGLFLWGPSSGKDGEIEIFRENDIPYFHSEQAYDSINRMYDWVEEVWGRNE